MISKLSDDANTKLLGILENVLRLSAFDITRMSDNEVLAIFNKLAFQSRSNLGVFSNMTYNMSSNYQNDIYAINNELIDMEMLL